MALVSLQVPENLFKYFHEYELTGREVLMYMIIRQYMRPNSPTVKLQVSDLCDMTHMSESEMENALKQLKITSLIDYEIDNMSKRPGKTVEVTFRV